MNKVLLTGRLTRDPEIRYTQSGIAVCTFTLAVDRRHKADGQPTADFISIVAWRKLAEICGNNLTKGRKVLIEGSMQIRSYEKDGSKRYVAEVIADDMEFLEKKSQADNALQPFGEAVPESDIPF
jgi:single-strand DNA-binding protein